MRAWIDAHLKAWRWSWGQLWHSPWGTLLALFILAFQLTLPALLVHLQHQESWWNAASAQRPHLTLYMQLGAHDDAIQTVWHTLAADTEVQSFQSIAPQEALDQIKRLPGLATSLQNLEHNPLPHTFVILPRALAPEALAALQQRLTRGPQVAQVKLDQQWAQRLAGLLRFAHNLARLLALLWLLASAFIVFHLVREQVQQQQQEIRISHWIGASARTIRRPFLYLGTLLGLLSALLALGMLTFLIQLYNRTAGDLSRLLDTDLTLATLTLPEILLLPLGTGLLCWLVAWVSSTWAIARVEQGEANGTS